MISKVATTSGSRMGMTRVDRLAAITNATVVNWPAVVHLPRKLGENFVCPVCRWMIRAARAISRSRLIEVTVSQMGI